MVFLIGLEEMPRQEKVALLAQLRAMTTTNVFLDGTSKIGLRAKKWTLRQSSRAANMLGRRRASSRLRHWDRQTDWSSDILRNAIMQQQDELRFYSDEGLQRKLWQELAKLADVEEGSPPELIGSRVVRQLALKYKIDGGSYQDTVLEELVYEECIKELFNFLQGKIRSMDRDEENNGEEGLERYPEGAV